MFALISTISLAASAQDATKCPSKPSVYAKIGSTWTEIPREADPITTIKPNFLEPALPKKNKEFAGEKAFITLRNPLEICVAGTASGASFSLQRAVAKKGTRTIVQIGDFHAKNGAEAQAMASVTDDEGSIHLLTTQLAQGQYILVMQGTFKPIAKSPSGNSQADAAAAAMESTMALAQSMASKSQGINFGFGVE